VPDVPEHRGRLVRRRREHAGPHLLECVVAIGVGNACASKRLTDAPKVTLGEALRRALATRGGGEHHEYFDRSRCRHLAPLLGPRKLEPLHPSTSPRRLVHLDRRLFGPPVGEELI